MRSVDARSAALGSIVISRAHSLHTSSNVPEQALGLASSHAAGSRVPPAEGFTQGAELGAVNYAARIEGLQFGLVNVAGHL